MDEDRNAFLEAAYDVLSFLGKILVGALVVALFVALLGYMLWRELAIVSFLVSLA